MNAEAIHDLFQPFGEAEGIKMGKPGMPAAPDVAGTAKTPSVDAVLALIGKEEVLKRIRSWPGKLYQKAVWKSFQTAFSINASTTVNCSDGLRRCGGQWSPQVERIEFAGLELAHNHAQPLPLSTLRCWLSLLFPG